MKTFFPAEIVAEYSDEKIIIKVPHRVWHYYKMQLQVADLQRQIGVVSVRNLL
ncbi:hypothetical protein [Fusibacter bizertensis]